MSDYGIKVSQLDESVFSDDASDVLMTSKYTMAKIDPTVDNTFATVQFTFVTSPATNTDIKWYSIPLSYDYKPQMWQIWWNLELGATPIANIATGIYVASTSPNTFLLWTTTNLTDQTLDFYVRIADFGVPPNITGLTGTYSHYIFADDLTVTT